MNILNLNTRETLEVFKEDFYHEEDFFLILSDVNELKLIKNILNIDEITFKDCLEFDENIKLDLFDKYDFLSINTFDIDDNKISVKEINMYLSDNFVLVVCDKNHFIFEVVRNMIINNVHPSDYLGVISLYKITYMIFKTVIIREFEYLEKIEDMILNLEDDIMLGVSNNHIARINYVRGIARTVVKTIRPLLYIGDRILKENIRYLNFSDIRKYNLNHLNSIDGGIDKLYNFALSTRELADKLLDIYSSKVAEKTNNLITKLTILTGVSAPLTIITGIYGMNFKYIPELDYIYGYPLTLGLMLIIVLVGLIIIKIKKLL